MIGYSYLIYVKVSEVISIPRTNEVYDIQALSDLVMQKLIQTIVWGSLATIVIVGGTAFIWAMLLTHRYEGPLISINRHLKELAKGNYADTLSIRKSDEVKTLVNTISELTSALKTKFTSPK